MHVQYSVQIGLEIRRLNLLAKDATQLLGNMDFFFVVDDLTLKGGTNKFLSRPQIRNQAFGLTYKLPDKFVNVEFVHL